jgi:hypothetical protein
MVGLQSNNDRILQLHDGQYQVVIFSPELLLTEEETCAAYVSLQ